MVKGKGKVVDPHYTSDTAVLKAAIAATKDQVGRTNNSKAKSDRVKGVTNFNDTYADILFPYLTNDSKVKSTVGDGSVNNAPRLATIKIKREIVKQMRIDSAAGFGLEADGNLKGTEDGFGAVRPIKIHIGNTLKTRKPSTRKDGAKPLSTKYYARIEFTLSVPKDASAMEVFAWIKKSWKVQPISFKMGATRYPVEKPKQVYNNGKSRSEASKLAKKAIK